LKGYKARKWVSNWNRDSTNCFGYV